MNNRSLQSLEARRINRGADIPGHYFKRLRNRHRTAVGPLRRKSVEDIRRCDDAGVEIDLIAFHPSRIAFSVQSFVV